VKSTEASGASCIFWFREDLRLHDHPALSAAVNGFESIVPVYILHETDERPWRLGGASRWWLNQSLAALDQSLREAGSRLIVRRGHPLSVLRSLLAETGGASVYWSRRYGPADISLDAAIKSELGNEGFEACSFPGNLLHEPWTVQNRSGKPFQVFTPFWKHCLSLGDPRLPLPPPVRLPAPRTWPTSDSLDSLALLPKVDWAPGLRANWIPGEQGACQILRLFIKQPMADYPDRRDMPSAAGTSQLSPHLHFGEISPQAIWHACSQRMDSPSRAGWIKGGRAYLRQLIWREFAHHLLFHFPHTPQSPLRAEFEAFPWKSDPEALSQWQRGQTGYPIVDAGMRQLWTTGWMHNRVRMIVASFLVKDLLIHWSEGARWFWDTLVDADLANNTLGWQWAAGCGADAAPYFRIFNPVLQGQRFDPDGSYVRQWVSELEHLPSTYIHHPWDAPAAVRRSARLQLGKSYPTPMVNHAQARNIALDALAEMKKRVA
jgi:deoxyribodipyrimidine photo-lyase